jgi:hypothetical protein
VRISAKTRSSRGSVPKSTSRIAPTTAGVSHFDLPSATTCSSPSKPTSTIRYGASTMATRIWLEELQEQIDRGAQVVEVLPQDDYRLAHLPGAVNLPLRELDEHHAAVLDRTRPVVVYCWDPL